MMGGRSPGLRLALMVMDFLVVIAAFTAAASIRFGTRWVTIWEDVLELPPVTLFGPAFGVLLVGVFWSAGLYRPQTRWTFSRYVLDVFRAIALALLVTLSLLFFFKLQDVSRILLGTFFVMLTVSVLGIRALVSWIYGRFPKTGRRRVLLVGDGPGAATLIETIGQHPELGVEFVGRLGGDETLDGGLSRLGEVEDLPEVLADRVIDEVVLCLPPAEWSKLSGLAAAAEEQGKAVRIPVDMGGQTIARGRVEDVHGLPVVSLVTGPDQSLALGAKRMMDVIGALALLAVTAPILLVSAVAIWMRDRRPIFFLQRRGGLHGRPFTAVKFRTMRVDAEELKPELAAHNERIGPAFKMTDDPRVTATGRWLRRSSIDELPQLLNVLRGDMSLVGPRPQPVEEVAAYDLWHRRRLSMRPGLTGLWQVTARNDPEFSRWMELDLEYIDSWSLWLDLWLIIKTPVALIRSPGT